MRVIALLALCFAAVAAVPKNPQRIVGGSVTTIDQYPSMASLLFSSGLTGHRQACGGTILNNRSILTAAHCTIGDAAARWQVRVGSTNANSGGTVYRTQSIINHPNYSTFTSDNDIGLIRILGTFTYSSTVLPSSIAGNNYNLNDDEVVWATGWGAVSPGGAASEQLRHVQVWTINQQTCATRYASMFRFVTDNMLCSGWLDVGGRDQCQGDSGGPLYHNGIVVGVCSWGYSCALPRYPGVNARVSRFTTWIVSNV